MRIVIVGTSGSGKTTLARQVAARLQIPHVELDALHWEPNWTPADLDVFRQRIVTHLGGDRWVVDGNYSKVRALVWQRATTVVWLDFPFGVVLGRIVWRTLWRGITRQTLWNGNRETLRQSLFSRDSMILWMLHTYHKRRQSYPLLFQQPDCAHLTVVRLRSPHEAAQWLAQMVPAGGAETSIKLIN